MIAKRISVRTPTNKGKMLRIFLVIKFINALRFMSGSVGGREVAIEIL